MIEEENFHSVWQSLSSLHFIYNRRFLLWFPLSLELALTLVVTAAFERVLQRNLNRHSQDVGFVSGVTGVDVRVLRGSQT